MSHTIRRIGASRLATVSEVQTPAGQHVALKEFNRQPLSPFQKTQIFAAADRWTKLNNAGLVPYLQVSAREQSITMELFDRSAAIRLREGPSDPRLVLHTLRGVLAALAPLHTQALVHANLKPSNVFFDSTGRTRLSDGWVIVPAVSEDLPPPINLKYLAPEQANPDYGPLTPASDVYCLGLLALELLAGDRFALAFQGMRQDASEEDAAWSQWHGSSQVAPDAKLFSKECPGALARVLARMVAKQPQLRYADARQALQDLPQDIAGQLTTTVSARASISDKKSHALAAHILPRPATGVVLAIASGSRAGEMIGSNENELMLGFDHDCVVRFSYEHYPAGGSKVLLRRGSQGWYALRVSGNTAFVNQRGLDEKCALRSGDIVRLSSQGPDVQFTMQSGGVAIRALVERFLPTPELRSLGPETARLSVGTGGSTAQPVAAAKTAINSGPDITSPATARPGSVQSVEVFGRQWVQLHPQGWHANYKNIALGVIGVVLVLLIASFLLWSTGSQLPTDSDAYDASTTEAIGLEGGAPAVVPPTGPPAVRSVLQPKVQ